MTIAPEKMGWITDSVHYNPVDHQLESRVYALEGGPYFALSMAVLHRHKGIRRDGNVVTVGPYRLIVAEEEPWNRQIVCILDTGWWSRLRAWGHRHSYLLQRVKSRLIITCAVWGLADYCGEMAMPAWSDIHLVRRFQGMRHG